MGIATQQWAAVQEFLCEKLGGDWLLTGGTLVRLLFDDNRGTEDIDLVRVAHPTLSPEKSLVELYQFLKTIGLGPESVNPAVEPFVQEIPEWKGELILIREGARGRIYRPTLTAFVFLKLKRATPIDLEDIRAAVRHLGAGEFDEAKLLSWADASVIQRFQTHKRSLGL